MTRFVAERWSLTGHLVCDTPLSICGAQTLVHSDAPLIRDGNGEIYIPGTSIAGAVRAFTRRVPGMASMEKAFWGAAPKKNAPPDDASAASLVVVEDAPIADPIIDTEMRDGVGIDPVHGRAATGIKFDREVAPKGARFSFSIHVDELFQTSLDCKDEVGAAAFLSVIRAALEKGMVPFGAGSGRGLGRLHLEKTKMSRARIGDRVGVLDFLRNGPQEVNDPGNSFVLPSSAQMRVAWRPRSPILVKSREAGAFADQIPLTSAVEAERSPVIPGSSIKGALRAIAERIMATVSDNSVSKSKSVTDAQAFLQMKGDDADPLVSALFGRPRPKETTSKSRDPFGRGAIRIDDVYGNRLPSDLLTIALNETGANGARKLRDLGADPTMHVAVDRWTAAPVEHRLFGTLAISNPSFAEIVIEIDTDRLQQFDILASVGLIALTLQEAANGQLTLGGGATRGFGAVEIFSAVLEINGDGSPIEDLAGLTIGPTGIDGPEKAIKQIKDAWLNWIKNLAPEGETE